MAWTVRHRSVSLLARVCNWFTEGFDTADPAHINTRALGRALAETLADRHAALIRAHGAVLVPEGWAEQAGEPT